VTIEVRGVSKTFGQFVALSDVDLEIRAGELVGLLGPSGSGKTTLLRVIAGLESPDSGYVRFDGIDITDRSVRERHVGFVFQHYALFRHLTVFENVAFGLRVRPRSLRLSSEKIRAEVNELLHLVQLEKFTGCYPSQLSGGQRQRVALARALAVQPRILLLDEPFGSLDAKVRLELRRWLRRLHDKIQITSVFVTHDQEEALELSDRVAVMNQGRVVQVGSPDDVYNHPATPFVCDFLGNVNLFHGRIEGDRLLVGPTASDPGTDLEDEIVYVRSYGMDIDRQPQKERHFKATVRHINATGPLVKVEAIAEWGDPVQVEISQDRFRILQLKQGEEVFLSPREIRVFRDARRPD
jgi:sulfate transport system ATP-binding protein